MTARMPCRDLFIAPVAGGYAIFGPPPDGQRCYAWSVEADGMTWNHVASEDKIVHRLERLYALESRSLLDLPDGK